MKKNSNYHINNTYTEPQMRIRNLEFTHIIQRIQRNLDLSYRLCDKDKSWEDIG